MSTVSRNRTRWIKLISAALLSALLFTGFTGITTAYADDGDDPAAEKNGSHIDERLESCLERLNEWYQIQGGNVGKANNAIARVEQALAKASELGLDTSEIEALMPALYAAVTDAEAYHARADQILSEHAGFNGGGKVKDRQQALETCKSTRDSLASARDSLLQAREMVREIIEIAKELRDSYVPPADVVS
jgi:Asp-tRNA(Asn)/Glu-tRNA(Gln) amidotransferase A subunit family amidase